MPTGGDTSSGENMVPEWAVTSAAQAVRDADTLEDELSFAESVRRANPFRAPRRSNSDNKQRAIRSYIESGEPILQEDVNAYFDDIKNKRHLDSAERKFLHKQECVKGKETSSIGLDDIRP